MVQPEVYLFQEDGVAAQISDGGQGRWAPWDAPGVVVCLLDSRTRRRNDQALLFSGVAFAAGYVGGTRFPVRRKRFMVRGGVGDRRMSRVRGSSQADLQGPRLIVAVRPRGPGMIKRGEPHEGDLGWQDPDGDGRLGWRA